MDNQNGPLEFDHMHIRKHLRKMSRQLFVVVAQKEIKKGAKDGSGKETHASYAKKRLCNAKCP